MGRTRKQRRLLARGAEAFARAPEVDRQAQEVVWFVEVKNGGVPIWALDVYGKAAVFSSAALVEEYARAVDAIERAAWILALAVQRHQSPEGRAIFRDEDL